MIPLARASRAASEAMNPVSESWSSDAMRSITALKSSVIRICRTTAGFLFRVDICSTLPSVVHVALAYKPSMCNVRARSAPVNTGAI